jgi:hypothetical protein
MTFGPVKLRGQENPLFICDSFSWRGLLKVVPSSLHAASAAKFCAEGVRAFAK